MMGGRGQGSPTPGLWPNRKLEGQWLVSGAVFLKCLPCARHCSVSKTDAPVDLGRGEEWGREGDQG